MRRGTGPAHRKVPAIFCLYEGPGVDAAKRVHERAGHPTEEIYEVSLAV